LDAVYPQNLETFARCFARQRGVVKRLSVEEKRQMDELLTESVLDLLIKYKRLPKSLQKLGAN